MEFWWYFVWILKVHIYQNAPCKRLANALVASDLYGLFLHSGHFSFLKGETLLSYCENTLFTFFELNLVFQNSKIETHVMI